MTADPRVNSEPGASWLDRRRQTERLEYPDHDDERAKWQADRTGVAKVLARAGMFQGIDPAVVSALTSQLHHVDFQSGQTIFVEGEPGDRLYVIVSGKVKIGRCSPDGRDSLLTILGSSDMFGELSIFDPGLRTSSATTVTEVRRAAAVRRLLRPCGSRT